MVKSVAYEYSQVARNLGVVPELLLELHRQGTLPGTKVGKRSRILIADRDLLTVLGRCLMVKAAKQLNLNEPLEPLSHEVDSLSEAILVYLERRYGYGLLVEMVEQVVNKLSAKRDSWRNRSANQARDAIREKMTNEIVTRLLPRRVSRLNRSRSVPEIVHLADAA